MIQLIRDGLETNWLAALSTRQFLNYVQKEKLLEDSG